MKRKLTFYVDRGDLIDPEKRLSDIELGDVKDFHSMAVADEVVFVEVGNYTTKILKGDKRIGGS